MSDERARMAQRMLREARTPAERRAVERALLRMQNNPEPGPTYTVDAPVVHYDEQQTASARRLRSELERLPPAQQRAAYDRLMQQQNNPRPGPTIPVDADETPMSPQDSARLRINRTQGREDEAGAFRHDANRAAVESRARVGGSAPFGTPQEPVDPSAERAALEALMRGRYPRG